MCPEDDPGGAHARPEAVSRFLVEAQAIARVRHSNIVQIYHIGERDGLPYLELEYVEGGGLDRLLDGTPRAAGWSAGLVEPLARAVAEADTHRRQINAIRARTWADRAIRPIRAVLADDSWPGGLPLHPGGRHLIATTLIDGSTRDAEHGLWDLDRELSLPFPDGSTKATAASWSPDGRSIAVAAGEGGVSLCSFPEGGTTTRIAFPGRVRLLEFSADGRFLAIAGGDLARVWDVEAGAFATPALEHENTVAGACFSPDGRTILTWGMGNDLRFWEADSGRPRFAPVVHGDTCHDARFSPSGRLLAVASYDGSVRVRDSQTGAVVAELPEHPDLVYSAAFSPDGRRLVSACRDRQVRVWDCEKGEPPPPPRRRPYTTTWISPTRFERSWTAFGASASRRCARASRASECGTTRSWSSRSSWMRTRCSLRPTPTRSLSWARWTSRTGQWCWRLLPGSSGRSRTPGSAGSSTWGWPAPTGGRGGGI
ncbi:hypothetical protein TsocGM_22430 [Tautonia sociabilis]|uniref:Uncharacterized protein n=1 Tax=Tautonia sociabilis TaxID=2080755 RepID=A0A432MDY8_9BACT|nr:hypothetical protein TsocGM_22430 [Tautonia sociabilis]